jgi:uncharacterized sporulation protein YeaH/YhbH (DUF444 family)
VSAFSDIQKQDLREYKQSAVCASRRANGISLNTDSAVLSNSNKTRWFVDTRPRADSLTDVMRGQEEQQQATQAELMEALEIQAAIDAVEQHIAASEKKAPRSKYKGSGKPKQRTASL